jgi:hypothetical protein
VGAQISVCAPLEIAGQPSAWAGVGCSNEASNQARTLSLNGCKGDVGLDLCRVANPPILRSWIGGSKARSRAVWLGELRVAP